MKKAVKVLLGIAAAGASASAAAFAVKKYRDGHKKYAGSCDDFFADEEPDTVLDEDDDYHFTPEEEESLIGTDDGEPVDEDTACNVVILEKDEVAFIKYLADGIKSVAYLLEARNEDIERLIRRRNISNADKLAQIRALCAAGKDNVDLLNGCAEDISDVVSEKTPEDFWEFIMNDYKEDTEDGE